jgi:thiol-disulfide isomerase/thioredoxin
MKSGIIVAFLFVIVACKSRTKDASASTNANGPEISKIQLKDLNDQPINLEKYKGKTIFINFWATWCQPCLAEMPSIEKAQTILQNDDVVFLLASSESASEIEEFRNARGYKFNYTRIENSEELGIQALPTTYIFNPDGQLAFSEQGYRKWDEKDNIVLIRKIAKNND